MNFSRSPSPNATVKEGGRVTTAKPYSISVKLNPVLKVMSYILSYIIIVYNNVISYKYTYIQDL